MSKKSISDSNQIPFGEETELDASHVRFGAKTLESKYIPSTFHDIHQTLLKIKIEKKFMNLIINFFRKTGYLIYGKHSSTEHGLDVLMILPRDRDPLRRGQFFLFQVKQGTITNAIWKNTLFAQINDLIYNPIKYQPYDSNLVPKIIILITNGGVDEYVLQSIENMNQKLHLTIEVYDGQAFADILYSMKYTIENINHDSEDEGYLLDKE